MSETKGIHTGETSRDTLGVGAIINPKHQGRSKRPTEDTVINRSPEFDNPKGHHLYKRVWIDEKGDKHEEIYTPDR